MNTSVAAFLASLILGTIVYLTVALAGGPEWARYGFGFLAYLVCANGNRA